VLLSKMVRNACGHQMEDGITKPDGSGRLVSHHVSGCEDDLHRCRVRSAEHGVGRCQAFHASSTALRRADKG
jgi:hypothetical protein